VIDREPEFANAGSARWTGEGIEDCGLSETTLEKRRATESQLAESAAGEVGPSEGPTGQPAEAGTEENYVDKVRAIPSVTKLFNFL
jgi:hypothetical protein